MKFDCKSIINDKGVELSVKNKFIKEVNARNFTSVWFHGGGIFDVVDDSSNELNRYLSKSYESILNNFLSDLNVRKIGSLNNNLQNKKISNLYKANSISIKTPKTLLTTDKIDLISFLKGIEFKGVVCKSMIEGSLFFEDEYVYDISKTFKITDTVLGKIPDKFGLTLFQEEIKKKFEIRVIYWEGELHAAAIIDDGNSIDVRISLNGRDKPRIVPYVFSGEIENKIIELFALCGYTYGSADFIYSADEEYVFLEINPCGQVSFINKACNFYLEKDFANYLINGKV